MILTKIHVNQHNIRANLKNNDTSLPVITVKDYKQNRKGQMAEIISKDGEVLARVVYACEATGIKPLSCGARVWIETKLEVKVL